MNSRDERSQPSPVPTDSPPNDELLLQRVRAVLSPMPEVNRRAIANILSVVAERRPTRLGRWRAQLAFTLDQFRYATSPVARMSALAVLCVTVGFVARGVVMRDPQQRRQEATTAAAVARAVAPAPVAPSVPTQTVSGTASAAPALVPVQFVLDARQADSATSVSVVGDFNDWNVAAALMALEGGVWSVALPLAPGRHVYAFVINGERWIADPRAPRAADSDFGRPGSVIIVQAP